MKNLKPWLATFAAILAIAFTACGSASAKNEDAAATQPNDSTTMSEPAFNPADTSSVKVEVNTTLGKFTILLYGDTPATATTSSSTSRKDTMTAPSSTVSSTSS